MRIRWDLVLCAKRDNMRQFFDGFLPSAATFRRSSRARAFFERLSAFLRGGRGAQGMSKIQQIRAREIFDSRALAPNSNYILTNK